MSPIVKREKEKFKMPSKYVLLILTVLCVVMMAVTFFVDYMGGPLSKVSGYIVVPFQEGISTVGTYLSDKTEEWKNLKNAYAENEELKAQIEELTEENTKYKQDHFELEDLRKLLELDDIYDEYEKVTCRIIAKDTSNFYSVFLINKGSDDGITVNMNVIADGGLVGRVTKVGNNWARVLSIIDDSSYVSAMVLSTGDNLILSGSLDTYLEEKISFSQLLDSDDLVAVGDKIVTSNISDKYLPGILIGYISELNINPNNLSKSGTLTPVVDFEHLSVVSVILQCKEDLSGELDSE